jgi:hypothetical protein
MDRFSLYLKHEDYFENLVWHLCVRLFGVGTSKFARGKDGGKDARFVGTAERYPSRTSPWSGTVIIQAKHTQNPIASCSDPEFQALMKIEKGKICSLKEAGELTHYICFTNRKKSGVKGDKLQKTLRAELALPGLTIEGIETIQCLLSEFSELITTLGLELPAPSLTIYPEELERLIVFFDQNVDLFQGPTITPSGQPFEFRQWDEKNVINNLSSGYFQDFIVADSMSHFEAIENFLKNVRNREWQKRYENVAAQFRQKYYVHRDSFPRFEQVFDDIFNRLRIRGQLPGNDRLIYVFLHFMYCTCDLGQRGPAQGQ